MNATTLSLKKTAQKPLDDVTHTVLTSGIMTSTYYLHQQHGAKIQSTGPH